MIEEKWKVLWFLGSGQKGVQPEDGLGGTKTEGRRTLLDDYPKFRSSGAQSDGV